MTSLNSFFATLTRDTLVKAYDGWDFDNRVKAMLVTAVGSMETGIGTGPTLEQVIEHYLLELEYEKVRNLPDTLLQHLLDKALLYTDVGPWNSTTAWKLPSLRYHMDTYNYGQFGFMKSEYYRNEVLPQVNFAKSKLRAALPFVIA
jgi:hypothetical protein